LLALVAPEHASLYARRSAEIGGETMRFRLTNDASQEFQDAKHAFIAHQAERRRAQPPAWSSTTAAEATDLDAMNHQLEHIYAAMSSTPDWHQTDLGVHTAALRMRRDAARALLNQTRVAEIQRLDEVIARSREALSRATSDEERAALTAQNETLRRGRVAAEQKLAASQDAELQERWRDITALEAIAAHADHATRITLDVQLTELRDTYAAARQARSTATTRAA